MDVKKLAEISKLKFTDEQLCEMGRRLEETLPLLDVVKNCGYENEGYSAQMQAQLREDSVHGAEGIKNGFFTVPKVVE